MDNDELKSWREDLLSGKYKWFGYHWKRWKWHGTAKERREYNFKRAIRDPYWIGAWIAFAFWWIMLGIYSIFYYS